MSSVVVTGAAKGIGAGITEAFARAGWSVVAIDRDKAPLEQTAKRIGRAVVTLAKLIDDSTPQEFDRLFSINVKALMYLAQAAHKALGKTKGSLTVIASKTGLVAQRDSPLYCATKGAAIQLARALALDWAPEGIRVNAVCPGIVDTPMLKEFFDAMPDPAAFRRENELAQPLGRLATPGEIASVVLFLATPAAGFITGVALPVDGGFTAE